MSAPITQRIEQIFMEAEALSPEARPSFLRHACAGDDETRREVEILLEVAAVCEDYFNDLSGRLAGTMQALTRALQKR